jgi:hypothetical protein
MNIEQLIDKLSSDGDRNATLEFLENIVVDSDPQLISKLAEIARSPSSIKNTNRFASLLVALPSEEYISPLVDAISHATKDTSPWLADYMYALGSLLEERDDWLEVKDDFVHLLGFWLGSTNGGEISWKAGIILAELGNQSANSYLRAGAKDTNLFHQTRIACLRGFVNKNRNQKSASCDALLLLEELQTDTDEHVREEANNAIVWLQSEC